MAMSRPATEANDGDQGDNHMLQTHCTHQEVEGL